MKTERRIFEILASHRTSTLHALEAPSQSRLINIDFLQIDTWTGHARLGGTQLRLSKTELRVLLYLARHSGRAVPTSELLSAIWKSNEPIGETAGPVKSCIRRLREKIELDPAHPQCVLTVRGCGYLVPKLQE